MQATIAYKRISTQANISKKQITGSITAQDKVYDGTTSAIVNGSLNGLIR
jgi:hypothetical protein